MRGSTMSVCHIFINLVRSVQLQRGGLRDLHLSDVVGLGGDFQLLFAFEK